MKKNEVIYFLFLFFFFFLFDYASAANGIPNILTTKNFLKGFIARNANRTCLSRGILFPFGPECGDQELSKDLTRSEKIPLGAKFTFMGHQFQHAYVNQHGFVSFQDSFYGQTMSQEDWPNPKYPYVDDPVFIAPFYAQTDLAGDKIDDITSTQYGRVLFKVIHRHDLPAYYTEEEKLIYEMTRRIITESQVGF